MRSSLRSARTVARVGLLLLATGCADRAADERPRPQSEPPPLSQEDQALYQKLESQISDTISDETQRYSPLQYKYNEGLLEILDQIDRSLSGKNEGDRPRFLPKLDLREESDHFRETVRRWEAATGKKLRAEVDTLKADVAARKPGERFHPEFQSKFSRAFDEFIPLEVAELRDRRNVAIHAAAEKLLAPYRGTNPEPVHRIETILNKSPYDLPATTSPGSSGSPQPKGKS